MRFNSSSWFQMRRYDKNANESILFGPALQRERTSYVYPDEVIKKDEIVIWSTDEHKTVSLKSYERAHQTSDKEALEKITAVGIPLNCTFGGVLDLKKTS